ncbi:MAG: polymorphic toxin-type HINT domain-containing protein [Hyphomicrobiaceae bacterium]
MAAGARLINSASGFSEVVSVTVEDKPLDAYNLEVETFHTFFVASPANDNAPAVWVHNACAWYRTAADLQEQMALDAAKGGAGDVIIRNLGDPRFSGMDKVEYVVKSDAGRTTTVHYVRDPVTGASTDFKIKSSLNMAKQK